MLGTRFGYWYCYVQFMQHFYNNYVLKLGLFGSSWRRKLQEYWNIKKKYARKPFQRRQEIKIYGVKLWWLCCAVSQLQGVLKIVPFSSLHFRHSLKGTSGEGASWPLLVDYSAVNTDISLAAAAAAAAHQCIKGQKCEHRYHRLIHFPALQLVPSQIMNGETGSVDLV